MSTEYRHSDALVSTDWLADHLDEAGLRVFECTTYLEYLPPGQEAPYRVVSGRADYEQAHVKNAGFLDIHLQIHGRDLSRPDLSRPDLSRLAVWLVSKDS